MLNGLPATRVIASRRSSFDPPITETCGVLAINQSAGSHCLRGNEGCCQYACMRVCSSQQAYWCTGCTTKADDAHQRVPPSCPLCQTRKDDQAAAAATDSYRRYCVEEVARDIKEAICRVRSRGAWLIAALMGADCCVDGHRSVGGACLAVEACTTAVCA